MKPAQFEYFCPGSLDEALGLLAQYGDDAKVLAGGQSLVPLMNMRLAKPSVIVDINRLSELDRIDSRDGMAAIGALTRHRSVERSPLLQEICPMLPQAAGQVADVQVRNRGTFGGSISHADPASEFCAVLATLGGAIATRSATGSRQIAVEEFFIGPLMTCLEPTEIVTEITLPTLQARTWSFRSVSPRHGDLAIAGVALTLDVDAAGICSDVRIGLFGVGPTPLRASAAEAMLKGNKVDERLIGQAAAQAATEADPVSDVRASASYRRELVKRLVAWNLNNASDSLSAGGGN